MVMAVAKVKTIVKAKAVAKVKTIVKAMAAAKKPLKKASENKTAGKGVTGKAAVKVGQAMPSTHASAVTPASANFSKGPCKHVRRRAD